MKMHRKRMIYDHVIKYIENNVTLLFCLQYAEYCHMSVDSC